MMNIVMQELMTFGCYLLFVGFCFCDGFKLNIVRKLIWFAFFIALAITVFTVEARFDLNKILPLSALVAFLLCWIQNQINKKKTS